MLFSKTNFLKDKRNNKTIQSAWICFWRQNKRSPNKQHYVRKWEMFDFISFAMICIIFWLILDCFPINEPIPSNKSVDENYQLFSEKQWNGDWWDVVKFMYTLYFIKYYGGLNRKSTASPHIHFPINRHRFS